LRVYAPIILQYPNASLRRKHYDQAIRLGKCDGMMWLNHSALSPLRVGDWVIPHYALRSSELDRTQLPFDRVAAAQATMCPVLGPCTSTAPVPGCSMSMPHSSHRFAFSVSSEISQAQMIGRTCAPRIQAQRSLRRVLMHVKLQRCPIWALWAEGILVCGESRAVR
jgi:hypothetical protein